LTAFEDSLLYRTLPASGNPCPLGSTNPQGCVKQLGANSTWFFPLELTTLELYFSLSMQISRSPNQPLPRVSLSNIQARVDVAALGLDPAAAIDPATNSSTQEQFSLPTTFNLLCDINQVDCSVVVRDCCSLLWLSEKFIEFIDTGFVGRARLHLHCRQSTPFIQCFRHVFRFQSQNVGRRVLDDIHVHVS
jgi:hypothetical protein